MRQERVNARHTGTTTVMTKEERKETELESHPEENEEPRHGKVKASTDRMDGGRDGYGKKEKVGARKSLLQNGKVVMGKKGPREHSMTAGGRARREEGIVKRDGERKKVRKKEENWNEQLERTPGKGRQREEQSEEEPRRRSRSLQEQRWKHIVEGTWDIPSMKALERERQIIVSNEGKKERAERLEKERREERWREIHARKEDHREGEEMQASGERNLGGAEQWRSENQEQSGEVARKETEVKRIQE